MEKEVVEEPNVVKGCDLKDSGHIKNVACPSSLLSSLTSKGPRVSVASAEEGSYDLDMCLYQLFLCAVEDVDSNKSKEIHQMQFCVEKAKKLYLAKETEYRLLHAEFQKREDIIRGLMMSEYEKSHDKEEDLSKSSQEDVEEDVDEKSIGFDLFVDHILLLSKENMENNLKKIVEIQFWAGEAKSLYKAKNMECQELPRNIDKILKLLLNYEGSCKNKKEADCPNEHVQVVKLEIKKEDLSNEHVPSGEGGDKKRSRFLE